MRHTLRGHVRIVQREYSLDGSIKYIFQTKDDEYVESVFIPQEHEIKFCISCQIGCVNKCAHCATGKMYFVRDLTSLEIASQVAEIISDRNSPKSKYHVLFMGMGEPFLNYENVLGSIDLFSKKLDIPENEATISTIGIIPKLYSFSNLHNKVKLAISVHAPTDELRTRIIPLNKIYSLNDLLLAARYYIQKTGKRIVIEYCIINAFNDSISHAARLVELIKDIYCEVDIIPFNENTDSYFETPPDEKIWNFHKCLLDSNIESRIKKSFGIDIRGGCGQLCLSDLGRKSDMSGDENTNEILFLFADLVGSTSFKESHSFQEGLSKTQDHNNIVCECVEKNEGKVFKLVGDGIIATFGGADPYLNALNASTTILLEVDRYNEDKGYFAEAKRELAIETKIGISYGIVKEYRIGDVTDMVGECIDEAARLSSIALPNTILFKKSLLDKTAKSKFRLYQNNEEIFSNAIDNLRVKGKKERLPVCTISLDDIKRSLDRRTRAKSLTKKYFLQSRPIGEVTYIAIGGFMFSGKGIVARNISNRLGAYLIQDDYTRNPYLKWLYDILHYLPQRKRLSEISRRSILTNLWFLNHHFNLLHSSFREHRHQYDIFVSDFHLECDSLYCYAEINRSMRKLIRTIYENLQKSNNYKEPDAVIFLSAPPGYLINQKNEKGKKDPRRQKLEQNISKEYVDLVLNFFDQYMEQVRHIKQIPVKIIEVENENIEDKNSRTYDRMEQFLKEKLKRDF